MCLFWGVLVHVVQQETEMRMLRLTISQSQNCGKSRYWMFCQHQTCNWLRGNNGWKPKFTTSNPLVSLLRLALFRRSFGNETRGHVRKPIFISPVSPSKSALLPLCDVVLGVQKLSKLHASDRFIEVCMALVRVRNPFVPFVCFRPRTWCAAHTYDICFHVGRIEFITYTWAAHDTAQLMILVSSGHFQMFCNSGPFRRSRGSPQNLTNIGNRG